MKAAGTGLCLDASSIDRACTTGFSDVQKAYHPPGGSSPEAPGSCPKASPVASRLGRRLWIDPTEERDKRRERRIEKRHLPLFCKSPLPNFSLVSFLFLQPSDAPGKNAETQSRGEAPVRHGFPPLSLHRMKPVHLAVAFDACGGDPLSVGRDLWMEQAVRIAGQLPRLAGLPTQGKQSACGLGGPGRCRRSSCRPEPSPALRRSGSGSRSVWTPLQP